MDKWDLEDEYQWLLISHGEAELLGHYATLPVRDLRKVCAMITAHLIPRLKGEGKSSRDELGTALRIERALCAMIKSKKHLDT